MKISIEKALFVFGICVITFGYGLAVGFLQIFPHDQIMAVVGTGKDVYRHWKTYLGIEPDRFLFPAHHEGDGVIRYNADKAQPGVTFMTGFWDDQLALKLFDMEGNELHRWPASFGRAFPDVSHIKGTTAPIDDWSVTLHGAVLYENGDVVFNFAKYGLVRLDRCGNIVWTLPVMSHHSVDLAEDGHIWVASRHWRTEPSEAFPRLKLPFWDDTLLEVSPEGQVISETSVLDLLYSAGEHSFLFPTADFRVEVDSDDPLHVNDVEVLESEKAKNFEQFEGGDVVVSARNLNLVMVVDHDDKIIKWTKTNPWLRQHDPNFTDRGTILVFDNQTNTYDGQFFGGSRIIEVNPVTHAATVVYKGTDEEPFYAFARGKVQLLKNDNLLITDPERGRVFEATPTGEIVWEYINRYDDARVAEVTQGDRLPDRFADFTAKPCP